MVVCNEAHRFLVAEQLREMGMPPAAILLEPVGRNTAPAIALAAHVARQIGGDDAIMLVLPADHVLQDLAAFQASIRLALPAAAAGKLVAFGIVARTPGDGLWLHTPGARRGADRADRTVRREARRRARA